MKGIVFALPPLSEQERTLRAVEDQTEELVLLVQQARREIDLLREYRTRLIADVVTGKVDVREAAARLPEDTGDVEPLDEAEAEVGGDDLAERLEVVAEEAEA
jgi:type I restriction enzyme S subunit